MLAFKAQAFYRRWIKLGYRKGFFVNKNGMLFGYQNNKGSGYGLGNPFKLSPLQALGLRKRPSKVTKSKTLSNPFTGR